MWPGGGFLSRSDAVRDALSLCRNNNWVNEMEGRVSCAVSVIYADRKKHHVHRDPSVSDTVHSSMHTHLEHDAWSR